MSKSFVLLSFCYAALILSANLSTPSRVNAVKAADSWDEELNEEENPRMDSSRPRLREGTRIASVVGKFSKVGRRWMLEIEPTVEPEKTVGEADANRPKSSKAIKDDEMETKSSRPESKDTEATVVRYRVLENLTLQRVVDAIAQDPNDVRWIASGTITEFDGENWLLLSTVFRAHSTADPSLAQ